MEVSPNLCTSLGCGRECEKAFYNQSLGIIDHDDVLGHKKNHCFKFHNQTHEWSLGSLSLKERHNVSRYYTSLNESVSTQCSDIKDPEPENSFKAITKTAFCPKFRNSNLSKGKLKPIRAFLLSPDQMIEGYLRGRLCLSCDSTSHPMPKCPNQVFVCPNCHLQGHRGENCAEKCRFCEKSHPGRCILDCIQQTIRSMKLTIYDKKVKNFTSSSEAYIVENVLYDKNDDYDAIDPNMFDLTSRPDNAWGRTIYIKGIPINLSDQEVSSRLNQFLSSGYVTKVQLFLKRDHAFVTMSSKLSAAELISKKIVMEGKLLNLQWRKSGGYNKTFDFPESSVHKDIKRTTPQTIYRDNQVEIAKCPLNQGTERRSDQRSSGQLDSRNDCKYSCLGLDTPISLILQGLEMNVLTFDETIELVQKLLMEDHKP